MLECAWPQMKFPHGKNKVLWIELNLSSIVSNLGGYFLTRACPFDSHIQYITLPCKVPWENVCCDSAPYTNIKNGLNCTEYVRPRHSKYGFDSNVKAVCLVSYMYLYVCRLLFSWEIKLSHQDEYHIHPLPSGWMWYYAIHYLLHKPVTYTACLSVYEPSILSLLINDTTNVMCLSGLLFFF